MNWPVSSACRPCFSKSSRSFYTDVLEARFSFSIFHLSITLFCSDYLCIHCTLLLIFLIYVTIFNTPGTLAVVPEHASPLLHLIYGARTRLACINATIPTTSRLYCSFHLQIPRARFRAISSPLPDESHNPIPFNLDACRGQYSAVQYAHVIHRAALMNCAIWLPGRRD
jgi:hypothetical protein